MSAPLGELVALVVGGVDYGDADRIVQVLTRCGRASLFAHAAKKSRRRFAGALEPFSTIVATTSPRRKQNLQTIESAVVTRSRLALREDLGKIALASYVVELAARVAPEGEESEGLFELTTATLDALLDHPATLARRRAFEIAAIDWLGYQPQLEACVACGRSDLPAFFDFAQGGRLCPLHRSGAREVGPKTLEWMVEVLRRPPAADIEELAAARGEQFPEGWGERAARALKVPTEVFLGELLVPPLASKRLIDDLGL